jgi:iron-sulfur cluster assembly protein
MSITLTEKAAARVRDHLARNKGAVGLRLGVRKSGCSGLAYTVDFADTIGPDDVVLESGGVPIVVAADDLPALQGSRVDFIREGLNERFAFDNPNVTGQCGCGSSFTVQ